ncbi:phage tail tip lysozyme [Acinetobacter sp. C32I]|uniref:phage tail tip lysozyme n=1 Tax=Acinetobacter sp. C32I TaxID=2950074 RepID=UPI0020374FBA|nr:phage tail tip lysozyme [Acinetobacter sp. C32I]USA53873.1 phage tail tip lysozyme [Acinetobacter sp. C32I]
MATVIDALVMTLGLDASDFNKNKDLVKKGGRELTEESRKQAKQIEDGFKKVISSVNEFKKVMTSAFVAVAGTSGLKDLVTDVILVEAALGRLSSHTGQTTQELHALSNIVEQIGGKADETGQSASRLAQEITGIFYKGESGPMTDFLSMMNIQFADAQGKARDLSAIYLDLASKYDSGKFSKEQFFSLTTNAGFGAGEVDAIMKGRVELQKMIETQQKNSLITQKQAETARELMRSFTELKQNVASTSREFVDFVAPYLHEFLGTLKEVFGWLEENEDFVVGALAAIGGVIALTLVPALAAAVALTAPVAALAAAIGLLWDDYQAWKKGSNSFINWAVWEKEIKDATEALDKMWESLMRLTGSTDKVFSFKSVLKSAFGEIGDILHGVLRTITNVATALEFLFNGDWKRAARVLISTESNEAIRNLTDEQLNQPVPKQNLDASMGGWGLIKKGLANNPMNPANVLRFLRSHLVDRPPEQPALPYAPQQQSQLPKGETENRTKIAIDYFVSKGWTREQAIGLAANLLSESAMKTNAVGDGGKAHGLAQWHPARRADLEKYLGKPILSASFQEQLSAVQYELTKGGEIAAGNRLRNARSASDAGSIVSRYYERPKYVEEEARKRADLANRMAGGGFSPRGAGARGQQDIKQAGLGGTASVNNRANAFSAETHIGQIHIHTQATDANMIAQDISSTITEKNRAFEVYRFDSGMS